MVTHTNYYTIYNTSTSSIYWSYTPSTSGYYDPPPKDNENAARRLKNLDNLGASDK